MRFEYEITADEFVASQLLYQQLSGGRKRVERAVWSLLAGILFIATAWTERSRELSPYLLAVMGAYWIYCGAVSFFPSRYFRSAFQKSELVGQKFKAEITEEGFEVIGDLCAWRVQWSGVRLKGENNRVFLFCSYGTLFMFGKKYLSSEEQQLLRKLGGLS